MKAVAVGVGCGTAFMRADGERVMRVFAFMKVKAAREEIASALLKAHSKV